MSTDARAKNTCIQWLEWVSHTREIHIRHAVNGGEQQIGRYFVDGFAMIDVVGHVWEFLGYHGCPKCFDPTAICPLANALCEEPHRASKGKIQTLKSVYDVPVCPERA